jgi:hypothetical protein
MSVCSVELAMWVTGGRGKGFEGFFIFYTPREKKKK